MALKIKPIKLIGPDLIEIRPMPMPSGIFYLDYVLGASSSDEEKLLLKKRREMQKKLDEFYY